ncbi:MAG: DUF4352 domain-containing protein, partial [Clostridium sp.]
MKKMIQCKTCGNDIAGNAKSCPGCGAKNSKPFYKKWWVWVIAIILIAGIAGSSGEDSTENSSSGTSSEKPKVEDVKEFYAVGEEVKLKDNILVVNSISKSSGSEWDKPKDGNEFVIVTVTIKNGGTSEISYNPFDFSMQNSKGQITDQAFTTINNDNALSSGQLASGGEISGTIAFE